ncbi:MAG: deoxyuridine 5'-triphosphate nucleotidohydrolase [Erysipelotrichaceae bacterium]|nr:deoxyuridine 5'-triphosphate nucleotidohydrolase [Erysipelotrichaceae bacterium]
MNSIARFEKVSFGQFQKDSGKNLPWLSEEEVKEAYERIALPKRASVSSAGYDFVTPYKFSLKENEMILLPSGIRANIDSAFVLTIVPRSSLGVKYRLMLANTVGIIDADYYGAANEGHIQIALVNRGTAEVTLEAGERIVQGIFLPYFTAEEETVADIRTGGFGSSGK